MEKEFKEKHGVTDEEIDALFAALKSDANKATACESINKDTMDHLWTILDFSKFKQLMTETIKESSELESSQAWSWEEFQSVLNEEVDTKTSLWKCKVKNTKIKDNFKCSVYTKPQKGKVNFMRTESEMVNVDPHKIWDYLTNPPPNKMVKELKHFDQKENEVKIYLVMKVPLMSTRDSISLAKRTPLTDDSFFFSMQTIEHPDYPPKKKVIRMSAIMGGYIRPNPENPANYLYTEISTFDLKGRVPTKLINMTLTSEAVKEMKPVVKFMQK